MKNIIMCPGDLLDVLPQLAENSVDSVLTDPPYHLTSIVKRFGGKNAAAAKVGKTGAYARSSSGFMGQQWDGGDVAFRPETWREIMRVMKPGAYLLAFGGTRTYHRLACAIEDAGFDIRDAIMWHYGSGFPKSHNVSKGIDKAAGAEREVVGTIKKTPSAGSANMNEGWVRPWAEGRTTMDITAPATDSAREWQGWGTALKPATEIICLARKPLSEKTVAANVLKWRTGALNIDGCKVAHKEPIKIMKKQNQVNSIIGQSGRYEATTELKPSGRWPANLVHDGSEEVIAAFPDAPGQQRDIDPHAPSSKPSVVYGKMNREGEALAKRRDDSSSAARFFYSAKASARDRLGSNHPTVKPINLLRYFARLITPPGGVVLDPFAGTGTTGEAAYHEGMRALLIERDPAYQKDIQHRMEFLDKSNAERKAEHNRRRGK